MSDVAMIALLEGRYPDATRGTPPTPWIALAIVGGWVGGGIAPQIRIKSDGTVELRGEITGGAVPATFANIPAGLEPFAQVVVPVVTTDTAGPTYDSGVVIVTGVGAASIEQGIASIDNVNLDGISWSVFA